MKKWLRATLSSLGQLSDGDWILKENYKSEGVRLIQVGDVGVGKFIGKSSRHISLERAKELQCTFLKPGDILVSRMPDPLGRACIFPGFDYPAITAVDVTIFRPEPTKSRSRFINYFLNSKIWFDEVRRYATGTTRPRISRTQLEKMEVLLPPLGEQERIVKLLDEADELRKLRAQADRRTAALIPALFHEMFGDPATNWKCFRKESLGSLLRVKSGDSLAAKDMAADGKFPVYGGNGINGYHSKFMFEQPVIVIGRVGIHCGAVHLSEPTSWVTDNALYVCELKEAFDQQYLAAALGVANLNQYAGRAAQPLVSGNRIYPIPILVPPLSLQKEFSQRVMEIRGLESEQAASRRRLDDLFQSMLDRAFRGGL